MKTGLFKTAAIFGVCLVCSFAAVAQSVQDMDRQVEQSMGNYAPLGLDHTFNALGDTQRAWLDPLQHMGEGQTRPGYTRYFWTPELVLPIRIRRGMITLINFPEWELIENATFGDSTSFDGFAAGPNALYLYPVQGAPVGVDTNLVVMGRSGNRYVFYVRSEGINTEKITHQVVDIIPNNGAASHGSASGGGAANASFSSGGGYSGGGGNIASPGKKLGQQGAVVSSATQRFLPSNWLEEIPVDPEKFRFDIEIYVPNPDDAELAPERVWRDDIFTYIDLGPKALNMTQRPIVNLIVQDSEVPVGFRSRGPHGRLIVVEGIGDMILRNGRGIVCLKLRRDPARGLEHVQYTNVNSGWDALGPVGGTTYSAGKNNAAAGGVYPSSGTTIQGASVASSPVAQMAQTGRYGGSVYQQGRPVINSYGEVVIPGSDNQAYGGTVYTQDETTISIELGSDPKVETLEKKWTSLAKKHADIIGGFEPYFSVDAPAEGRGRELFHLRLGPVSTLEQGDEICSKLGRRGVFCSVVRTQ